MLKAIFFDLDGTLSHFSGNFREIFSRACQPIFLAKPSLSYEELYATWSKVIGTEGPLTSASALQQICQLLNITQPLDCIAMGEELCQQYASQVQCIAGAQEILHSLRPQYKLALITNGPLDMQHAAIHAAGIRSFFDLLLISGDPRIAVRKPNPAIFLQALTLLNVEAEDVLMVGDNLAADILVPSDMGMETLLVGTSLSLTNSTADYLKCVTSICELPKALCQMNEMAL